MKLAAASLMLLWFGTPSSAHRLDEYLQAAMLSLEKDRVQVQLRLTPGVAVFPFIVSIIDTDSDGAISIGEQRAYAAGSCRLVPRGRWPAFAVTTDVDKFPQNRRDGARTRGHSDRLCCGRAQREHRS
jgi:hypothetical protein